VRRTPAERKRLLEEQKKKIEARLEALSAREKLAERKRDTRRKVIVGAAVLAHAEIDPAFAAELKRVLRRAVQRPADQQTIADIFTEAQAVSSAV
jgi:hypothetical protein